MLLVKCELAQTVCHMLLVKCELAQTVCRGGSKEKFMLLSNVSWVMGHVSSHGFGYWICSYVKDKYYCYHY
jgi:hypothetical protein